MKFALCILLLTMVITMGYSAIDLANQVGKPVDLAPWTYVWQADREVQPQPEAYFIPRRLDRLDKVYRTAYDALPQDQLKSLYYDMPTLLQPLPPKPEGQLTLGLLWTGGLVDYQVQLHWPAGSKPPAPASVEVRAYPSAFGWFGWTVDQILEGPAVSSNGLTWVYKSDPTVLMDFSYNAHPPAATEMVAVFCKPDASGALPGVPDIQMVGPSLGDWQSVNLELEWGFEPGSPKGDLVQKLQPYMSELGVATPLGGGRHGLSIPALYAPDAPPGLDSRITVRTKTGGFTFSIKDLARGPILIPASGFFITLAGGPTAAEFSKQLVARGAKSIRQLTNEHPEATSFDQLMQEVRLWTCPEGTKLVPFPKVQEPAMQVDLPDAGWTDAWRAASSQLTGAHMWGSLAFEVGRVAHEMELIGLHEHADKIYQYFLESPGAKPDGDYSDGDGALEGPTSLRHDMGYSHNGTHASTGRLLFAMAERYFLTGDAQWFGERRARLQAAADWLIRQRRQYMDYLPNRDELFVAGLLPPCMLGDYALPACDWHWYYVDNALALQGLQRFADALSDFDPKAGRKYQKETEAYRADLRQVLDEEAILAPVRLGRDGRYHTYLPRMAYARGLPGIELGAPQFPESDFWMGALPLAEPFAVLDAADPRLLSTSDLMEEMGTTEAGISATEAQREQKGLSTADAWFWRPYSILPKASHTANIYLLQDDIPSFLRFWSNAYASMVGADGKLWEHWHLGNFDPCAAPDNGTAGWFMENFRNLLVIELDDSLWIAKATPRAWLEQGKTISVANAPTYFGPLAYKIVSDVDHGKITATIELPDRAAPKSVILRLRHPEAAPIKSVAVNGAPWKNFDLAKETITLKGLSGKATVVARY